VNKPVEELVDDVTLAGYLKRSSEYSTRYRRIAVDDIPDRLDRAVLNGADRHVQRRGRRRLQQWGLPIALAASAVLTFSIVTNDNVRNVPQAALVAPAAEPAPVLHETIASESDAYIPPRREDKSALGSITKADEVVADRKDASAAAEPARLLQRKERGFTALAPSPNAQAPAAPPPTAADQDLQNTVVVKGSLIASTPQEAALPVDAISAEELSAQGRLAKLDWAQTAAKANDRNSVPADTNAEYRRQRDPQLWLEHIRNLRKSGDDAAADREWQRFLRLYSSVKVAPDDIARPKTAKKPAP
jgi:hypothetical protein